jgi:hypothetical protein
MDYYDPIFNDNDEISSTNKDLLYDAKKLDKGYTKIWAWKERADGSLKQTKIDVYTTGVFGSNIRDAETGEFYKEMVGSFDEDLYFKVAMSTGELKSKNGSNTLFYTSPEQCMRHLRGMEISKEIIYTWELKKNNRVLEKRSEKKGGPRVLVK